MRKKILIFGGILILLVVITLTPLAFGFGKTGRETNILGKDYSLLNKKEMEERINKDFQLTGSLKLIDNQRTFLIETASISAKVDSSQTASNLLFRRLKEGIGKYIKAFFEKKDFELVVTVDEDKLNLEVAKIASQIDKPFIPSEIVLNGNLSVKDGDLGKNTDQIKLKDEILEVLRKYELKKEIIVPVNSLGQLPNDEEKNQALEIAKSFIGKSVAFKNGDISTSIDDKVLVNWVNFGGSCQQQKVSDYVDNLGQSLKVEAQDAVFKFENKKVLEFLPAKEGYSIDSEKMKTSICRDFLNWKSAIDKNIISDLPLIKVQPKVSNSDVNNLGIKELLGKGTSSFSHSTEIRNYNVEKGASIINRILVAPGETFSFIKNLGEVSLASGYKQAYIIKQGKTELDAGGGICQVSTTLFRALLDAGLNITQRQAHAYRVSYYEEDTKPGFDATVFIPNPDLQFVNDTGNYVLIQSYYDGKNRKLTYEIYGTSDGRKVEISNYKQWDAQPAPPDVWIDDPTLPLGKVVQDEHKIPGLKTSFEWTVTKNGEVINHKTFASAYVPWAAVYRKGTGN